MFCPHCGVKNGENERECFICKKKLPSLNGDAPAPIRKPSGRPVVVADPPAALGDRLIALALDRLFLFSLFLLSAAAGTSLWADLQRRFAVAQAGFAVITSAAFAIFLYHVILEGATGSTLGKAMVGIRVRHKTGVKSGLREALLRNLLRVIDGNAFYAIGFFVAIFSRRRQRLGDHIAGSEVVQTPVTLWVRILVSGSEPSPPRSGDRGSSVRSASSTSHRCRASNDFSKRLPWDR